MTRIRRCSVPTSAWCRQWMRAPAEIWRKASSNFWKRDPRPKPGRKGYRAVSHSTSVGLAQSLPLHVKIAQRSISCDPDYGRLRSEVAVGIDYDVCCVRSKRVDRSGGTRRDDGRVRNNQPVERIQSRDDGLVYSGGPRCEVTKRALRNHSHIQGISLLGRESGQVTGPETQRKTPCCTAQDRRTAERAGQVARIDNPARSYRVEVKSG